MSTKRRKLRIWWMDDEPDRLKNFPRDAIKKPEQLQGRTAELNVIKLGPDKGVAQVLQDFDEASKKGKRPDLIVIDQMLQLWNDVMQRGSSLAVAIRDRDPAVALVGVTGMTGDEMQSIEELQKAQFIEFYERSKIASGDQVPDLYAIADGYAALMKFFKSDVAPHLLTKRLCRLVNCPATDVGIFTACLPGVFKRTWDSGTSHVFARWVWHQLQGRPGLLYDDFEMATLLGLKLEGLTLLKTRLVGCEYEGVLASVSRPRWWVSRVREKVRELAKASAAAPLWSLGQKLIGEQHAALFSKCHGRPGATDAPTAVAFSDGTLRKRVQARISDTLPLDTDSPPFGFEQRRIYSPAEQ